MAHYSNLAAVIGLLACGAALANPFVKAAPAADADLLQVDKAFVFQGLSRSASHVTLTWQVAPAYYLYGDRLKVTVDAPRGVKLGLPQMPAGETVDDPEFGRVIVQRGEFKAVYPLPRKGAQPRTVRVTYQGCADQGLCYPPQTRILAVPAP